ncbi:peptidoglycan hydrolase-like protein with peptidoglycan-binding domain [Rhizobium herbae]|uniref:Peptidoglycan hydrolase-like protein with peptidoglycan-binding domain n=1 Tax=Rhizobium herbae TaxID=508661 RepID=A0ABS4ESI6_9HYPH|nr:peptidoglycan hydrolase-like protein with peptidoglycan-binding domain [Rhizobium herbae]
MVLRLAFGIGFALTLSASTAFAAGEQAPLQIIVSKDQQSLVVYDGDTVVATSNISSGKAGHSTPTGIFSILEKRRFHKSNIYSNAPMPFMQRLTWSGIALHASNHVPSYPASHGCVRLPDDFAKQLFKMTGRGLHVLISDRQLTPVAISDPFLFQPAAQEPALLSDATLRPSVSQVDAKSVEVATIEPDAAKTAPVETEKEPPIRMLITHRGQREITLDIQALLNQLGYAAGIPDGYAGTQTVEAVRAFQTAEKLPVDGKITPAFVEALYLKAGKGKPPNGQLLVRRDFTPLFETPVVIDKPEIALGTHFFQFQNIDASTGKGEWFTVTLDNALPGGMKKRLGITVEEDATAFNAAQRSMSRITIPDDARQRIDGLLAEGSSLTISDMGLGQETGDGTDFVTITHTKPKS